MILVVISVTLETCIHKIKTETKGKLNNKIYEIIDIFKFIIHFHIMFN